MLNFRFGVNQSRFKPEIERTTDRDLTNPGTAICERTAGPTPNRPLRILMLCGSFSSRHLHQSE